MAFAERLAPLVRDPASLDGIGLGCAPIGDLFTSVDEADARSTVITALDAGIRFFDTAPHYGAGLSERRLGEALRGVDRDTISIATKVGKRIVDQDGIDVPAGRVGTRTVPDVSRDGVLRSIDSSLKRLGVDRIDVLYLHDPLDVDAALESALPIMHQLRAEGVVRAIGVGMNISAPLARFIAEGDVDVVMVAGRYTLLDRSAAEHLIPVAVERGVGIVAAGVFNSGVLVDPRPGAYYDYRPAPPDIVRRAESLQSRCRERGVRLSAAAIQFPAQNSAVSGVVVGARNAGEVAQFVEDAVAPIPGELWPELDAA